MSQTAQTFVLVHGAWHGGWCWARVADTLRARGHRVTTPTQTGLGERAHLISRSIDLSVFVADIVNHLTWEGLTDVVLVGHSFGGCSIAGAADAVPERIRRLVFLDAMIVESGQSPFDQLSPDVVVERIRSAEETSGGVSLPVPPASAFGVHDPTDVAWLEAGLTPHPLATYASKLELERPLGAGLPAEYLVCTGPQYAPLAASRDWVRDRDWAVREIATGHDAMVTAPAALADMLIGGC